MLRSSMSVYLNPFASQVDLKQLRGDFQRTFFRHAVQFKSPPTIEELSQCLQEDVRDGVDIFGCVGGDGTVNRILREIHPGNAKIFVIPGGTANDLGHELGLSNRIGKMKRLVQYQTLKDVDVLDVNGSPFITHGGIGVGADLCESMNDLRKRSPLFFNMMRKLKADSYGITLAARALLEDTPLYRVRIRAPHLPEEGLVVETPMLLISNQPSISGKINIAPYTNHADRKFSVSVFLSRSGIGFLDQFIRLRMKKTLTNPSKFLQFEAESLSLEILSGQTIPFFGDGDILTRSNEFQISVRERPQAFYFNDPQHQYSSSYSLDGVPPL
jgi:diacylglycerol kinase family enzyme